MPAKEIGVPFREVNRLEIREVIRRWQLDQSVRQIAQAAGLSRKTVDKYIRAAREAGTEKEGDLPDWFVVGNPRLRHIPVPRPDHTVRRAVAETLCRSLAGASQLSPELFEPTRARLWNLRRGC